MKLKDYVKKEASRDGSSIVAYTSRFAYLCNMPVSSLKTYMYEDRMPGAVAAVKIYKASGKQVRLEDLLLGDNK